MSVGKFPNLRLLHVFITVAKYQGFANAQQELNLTVSAISNYMSELEEKLGITLCRRGRGGFFSDRKRGNRPPAKHRPAEFDGGF
ncbi:transcriptional regulator GbuR [Klebsiella michiganensis]|nr:transcriptional regulator GbuR [Klebsiella michiganensis]